MCETRLLTWNNNTHISQCIHCKNIFLWHNNVMVNFTQEEFASFRISMNKLDFSVCAIPFPDEIMRTIVCTPSDHVNLVFDKEEWSCLKAALDEAHCMQEVYEIIKL